MCKVGRWCCITYSNIFTKKSFDSFEDYLCSQSGSTLQTPPFGLTSFVKMGVDCLAVRFLRHKKIEKDCGQFKFTPAYTLNLYK